MNTDTVQIHNFHEGEKFHEHYRLLEHVGSGGFADVWRAKDELVDTIVALKIYTRLDKEGISELAKEYKEMRGIKHPNLLTGNHFDASGNIPYLEMDYCDGGSLAKKVGKMESNELKNMLRDIAMGLECLHHEGIVHQDIKPENILYDTEHYRYLLSDFGISSKSRTRLSHSVNKANMSLSMTEAYAPPEKFSGNVDDLVPDVKGDIFSLGMTVFELSVGKLPFDPPMATGREMLYGQGRLQLDYSKISDPMLRRIVERCTRYNKKERLSAGDILLMLDGKEPERQERTGTKPPTVTVRVNDQTGSGPDAAGNNGGRQKPGPPTPRPNLRWVYVGVAVAFIIAAIVFVPKLLRGDGTGLDDSFDTMATGYDLYTDYGSWAGAAVDGKPDGEGFLLYESDDKDGRSSYSGKMRKGLREDNDAELTYRNGNTYKGSFVNDEFGNGILTLKADGLYFKGDFKKDKPYNGTWYWTDGTVYSKVTNGVEKEG